LSAGHAPAVRQPADPVVRGHGDPAGGRVHHADPGGGEMAAATPGRVRRTAPGGTMSNDGIRGASGELVLALNCGSSSIKFAVFDGGAWPVPRTPLWRGSVQGIGGPSPGYAAGGAQSLPLVLDPAQPGAAALRRILAEVR